MRNNSASIHCKKMGITKKTTRQTCAGRPNPLNPFIRYAEGNPFTTSQTDLPPSPPPQDVPCCRLDG